MKTLIFIIFVLIFALPVSTQVKITPENFRAAVDYSKQSRGFSVLVMQGDKIILKIIKTARRRIPATRFLADEKFRRHHGYRRAGRRAAKA